MFLNLTNLGKFPPNVGTKEKLLGKDQCQFATWITREVPIAANWDLDFWWDAHQYHVPQNTQNTKGSHCSKLQPWLFPCPSKNVPFVPNCGLEFLWNTHPPQNIQLTGQRMMTYTIYHLPMRRPTWNWAHRRQKVNAAQDEMPFSSSQNSEAIFTFWLFGYF